MEQPKGWKRKEGRRRVAGTGRETKNATSTQPFRCSPPERVLLSRPNRHSGAAHKTPTVAPRDSPPPVEYTRVQPASMRYVISSPPLQCQPQRLSSILTTMINTNTSCKNSPRIVQIRAGGKKRQRWTRSCCLLLYGVLRSCAMFVLAAVWWIQMFTRC